VLVRARVCVAGTNLVIHGESQVQQLQLTKVAEQQVPSVHVLAHSAHVLQSTPRLVVQSGQDYA